MDKRDKVMDLVDDLIDLFHDCAIEIIPVKMAIPLTAMLVSDMYKALLDFQNYLDTKI